MPIYSATSRGVCHAEAPLPPPAPRGHGARFALAGLSAVFLASGALAARAPILRAIPALAPVYASMGLPTVSGQAVLSGVAATRMVEAGRDVLIVEGVLSDHSAEAIATPNLRLAVQDPAGRELYHWTIAAPQPRLRPDEAVSFRARLEAPPAESRHVFVRFARPDDDAWLAPDGMSPAPQRTSSILTN